MIVRHLIAILIVTTIGASCTPSAVVYDRHVFYNFQDEGFLDRNTIQTIGRAEYPPGDIGKEAADRICLERALDVARKRALSIILHTAFSIPGQPGTSTSGTFEQDYPRQFSEIDLIRAELSYAAIINPGFIALQDVRQEKKCSIIFRIEGNNLPSQIKSLKPGFEVR